MREEAMVGQRLSDEFAPLLRVAARPSHGFASATVLQERPARLSSPQRGSAPGQTARRATLVAVAFELARQTSNCSVLTVCLCVSAQLCAEALVCTCRCEARVQSASISWLITLSMGDRPVPGSQSSVGNRAEPLTPVITAFGAACGLCSALHVHQ